MRLFRLGALPGWVVLVFPWIVRVIDWWQRVEFTEGKASKLIAALMPSIRSILDFATSAFGNFCFTLSGLALVFLATRRRSDSVKVRDRLDSLSNRGEKLHALWINKKQPTLRTKLWFFLAGYFVRNNFKRSQYDHFNGDIFDLDDDAEMTRRMGTAIELHREDPQGSDLAIHLVGKLSALKVLRNQIPD